jgi:sugar O-acyltransferase (sialic acid O-acetyltransferase NeuD family)
MGREYLLVGSGGHAAGVREILLNAENTIAASVDPIEPPNACGMHFLSDDDAIKYFECRHRPVLGVGIGGVRPDSLEKRLSILQKYLSAGFDAPPIIHKRACISPSAKLGQGVVVLAGAIVNANAVVETGAILNTGSISEHDAIIGAGTHVAPGAIILGSAVVGSCAMIGASSVILPGETVENSDLVRAQTRYSR